MDSIGNEFMEMTKYQYLEPSEQSKGIPQPSLETEYDITKSVINLPKPGNLQYGKSSLIDIITNRRSLRKYSGKSLKLEELSYLLWCTQGVKKTTSGVATLRTVPSAGARHAFETYLLVNNIENLNPGLYRFLALEHKLVEVDSDDNIKDKVIAGCLGQTFIGNSSVTFIWAADVQRMKWRYGERGYRYLHLDAGHVCQNLYLAAESIDCGACAIGAFDDDIINNLMGLDGERQFVIYITSVGKK